MNARSVVTRCIPFLIASANLAVADSTSDLKPLLARPDTIVLQSSFSVPDQLKKEQWKPNQGTRWSIADGVLRGIPSTLEFQASKPDHKGLEPRVSVPVTPAQFIAKFSVRFIEGTATSIVPFVEFGHHVARIKFSADGVSLLADGDTLKVADAKSFKYEPGKWYHALAELKGDEFIIQFADGPTLYGRHATYGQPPPSGGNGLGVAGPKDGMVEIDNVAIWSIQAEEQPGWAAKRSTLPKFEPVTMKEKAKPAKAKQSSK